MDNNEQVKTFPQSNYREVREREAMTLFDQIRERMHHARYKEKRFTHIALGKKEHELILYLQSHEAVVDWIKDGRCTVEGFEILRVGKDSFIGFVDEVEL